jgi:zinc protease
LPSISHAPIAADRPPALPICEHHLANGLRLVAAEDHSRPVVNLQIWYHVGSKDEKPGNTGFAHLFEHLMFRGSRNVGPEQHMRYVRQAGGVVNAYTSFDTTVYWETFPSNCLERMLWLEADRMASLDVSQENFVKEREVVKEERRLRYENPPYGMLLEDILSRAYSQYPYRHPPIGSVEDLDRATIENVRAFHSTYYLPRNACLVAVGDFEMDSLVTFAEKHFGPIPSGGRIPRVHDTEAEPENPRQEPVVYPNAPLDAIVDAYLLPPLGHPDSYALEMAATLLSTGQSSRLYRKLVYEEQIASSAQGDALLLEGPSLFFCFALAQPGASVDQLASSLDEALAAIRDSHASEEEMTRAHNQVAASFVLGRDSAQAKADFLGRCAVLLGDPLRYNTEFERFAAVTCEDIRRVAARYLVPQRRLRLEVHAGAAPVVQEAE